MSTLPPELIHLDFESDAFRDAVALVSAYSYGDRDVCELLLGDAGRDLACGLTVFVAASIGLCSERDGCSFAETLEALGRTAARFAAGLEPS